MQHLWLGEHELQRDNCLIILMKLNGYIVGLGFVKAGLTAAVVKHMGATKMLLMTGVISKSVSKQSKDVQIFSITHLQSKQSQIAVV